MLLNCLKSSDFVSNYFESNCKTYFRTNFERYVETNFESYFENYFETNVLRLVLVLVGSRMLYLFNFETLKTKRSLSQRPSIKAT